MNKTTTVILVVLVLAVIAMAYMLFLNNKKWNEQDDINKALVKKFPDLPVIEVKTSEQIKEELEKKITETSSDEKTSEVKEEKKEEFKPASAEEINKFALKIVGMKKSTSFTDEEKQFYQNNKEAIEARLVIIRNENDKQKEFEKVNLATNEAIALINLSWEELKTKTKLKNHITKLNNVIEQKVVTDEKVLTAVNQKKQYAEEAMKAYNIQPENENGNEGELALTTGEEGEKK